MMTFETAAVKSADLIADLLNDIFEDLCPTETAADADDWAFKIPVRETEAPEDFEWSLTPTVSDDDDLPDAAYAAMAASCGVEW